MDAENLGRMFAPSIVRHETNTMDVAAAQVEAIIVSYLIVNVFAFSNRRMKESPGVGEGLAEVAGGGSELGESEEKEKEKGKEKEEEKIDFGEDDELETMRESVEKKSE